MGNIFKKVKNIHTKMPVFKVKVTFFNDVHKLEIDTDKPVAEFRKVVEEASGVEVAAQKLKFGRKCIMPNDLESFAGWAGTEDMEKGSTADYAYKITIMD